MNTKKQVLIVDDDESILLRLNSLLLNHGYDVYTAGNAHHALEILKSAFIPVIISDHRMPEMTGVKFLQIVKSKYPNTVRMVLSEYEDFSAISQGFNDGSIYKFLAKKLNDQEFLHNVNSAFIWYDELNKQESLNKTLDKTIEAVVITDQDGIIISTNHAFELLTHYKAESIIGNKLDIFDCDKYQFTSLQKSLSQNGSWEGRLYAIRKDDHKFPVFVSISAIKNNVGIVTQRTYYFIDLSEKEQIEGQLNHEMIHDKLTGLFNREYFNHQVSKLINSLSDENSIVILVIDIERFGSINTILGSHVGDELLKLLAKRLQIIIKDHNGLIARVGDDQFAIGMVIKKSSSYLYNLIDQVIEESKYPFSIQGRNVYLSINIGYSLYPDDSNEAIELLQNASTAANYAKKMGKKSYASFKQKINTLSSKDNLLISDIKSGIKNDEFVFYYQPIVDLLTNKIISVEGLLRWNHSEHGILIPKDFLSLCEETYLIVDIERKMIKKACKFLKQLNQSTKMEINISLNLSSEEFKSDHIYLLFKDIINKLSLDPKLIIVEITESHLIQNIEESKAYLEKLKSLGIRLSIDDFGTGYSCINYLTSLPFDIVKIDKSLIDDIEQIERKQIVLKGILELCKKIRLKTVVEGVETFSQLNFLREIQCDIIQGYLISKPLPEDDVIEFIKMNISQY